MLKQKMFFGCAVVATRYIECCCNAKTSKQFLGYSLFQGFYWPQQGRFKNGLKSLSVFCLFVLFDCGFVLFCSVFSDRNRKRIGSGPMLFEMNAGWAFWEGRSDYLSNRP